VIKLRRTQFTARPAPERRTTFIHLERQPHFDVAYLRVGEAAASQASPHPRTAGKKVKSKNEIYSSSTATQPFYFVGLGRFFSSLIYTQSVGLLGRGITPSQGRYLHTGQHKHRINAYTDIHALSGIRTHDPSVRASEYSTCLRPRCHCDRQKWNIPNINSRNFQLIL
jgi:hypothetical protein